MSCLCFISTINHNPPSPHTSQPPLHPHPLPTPNNKAADHTAKTMSEYRWLKVPRYCDLCKLQTCIYIYTCSLSLSKSYGRHGKIGKFNNGYVAIMIGNDCSTHKQSTINYNWIQRYEIHTVGFLLCTCMLPLPGVYSFVCQRTIFYSTF